MSEELEQNNDGTLSGLKKTVIGVITTAVMGVGTWGVTQLTGGDEPAPAPAAAPVINITNSNQQQQQAAGGGTTKIIERERVVEKPSSDKPAKPVKKKEGDEFKEEEPKW
jgi:hypothetical protein